LFRKRNLVSHGLRVASMRLWDHPDFAVLYPLHLYRQFCLARASVSLMTHAVARAEQIAATDPVAAGLIPYWRQLTREETGHDTWFLEDLEALGIPRQEVLARNPPPTIAAVVGAQYYWILHHHPVALLGYIAVMEGNPPTVPLIESYIEKTGLPRQAFRFYLRHAFLEPKHNGDLDRVLDTLPFTAEQWSLIGMSLAQTAHLAAASIDEMVDRYEERLVGASPPPTTGVVLTAFGS
jgi:Iron-containing redox enzyme